MGVCLGWMTKCMNHMTNSMQTDMERTLWTKDCLFPSPNYFHHPSLSLSSFLHCFASFILLSPFLCKQPSSISKPHTVTSPFLYYVFSGSFLFSAFALFAIFSYCPPRLSLASLALFFICIYFSVKAHSCPWGTFFHEIDQNINTTFNFC